MKKRFSNFRTAATRAKKNLTFAAYSCAIVFLCFFNLKAQIKIAVLTPEKNGRSQLFAEKIEAKLQSEFKVLDGSSSEAAFLAGGFEKPFNLTLEEAKNAGAAIGTNYFLLVKSELLRRSAFGREEYYESYAVVYAVSAKTGKLVFWKLESFDADLPSGAEKKSLASAKKSAAEISAKIKENYQAEIKPAEKISIEEVPAETVPDAQRFRPPLPYRRISPAYTETADFYNVEATVDIAVDIDGVGKILRTEILRWAGYGLDESVDEAVRKMNWRPAERKGKTLPMRILLRYNFKDIDDEEKNEKPL